MVYFDEWFKDFCDQLKKQGLLKALEEEFGNQTDDYGRIGCIVKYRNYCKEITECYNKKCNKKSEQLRNIGNKYYGKKDYSNAIAFYSKSIRYGEEGSKELALAYGNRSVGLLATCSYKSCEDDINLAFEKGYPLKLHYKLYERLGQCLLALKQNQSATTALKKGIASLQESDLEIDKKNELVHRFAELMKKALNVGESVESKTTTNHLYTVTPPIIPKEDKNKLYPCASNAFSIVENECEGRQVIATRDIPVGEVIISEKAFTSICLPSSLETHCYQCLSRFILPYPCRSCASVCYCSIECESKSWETFHAFECRYREMLTHDDVGLGHLALKMITQVGKRGLHDLEWRRKEYSSKFISSLGMNENGVFEPSDYFCVCSLTGNSNLRTLADLFRRSLLAIFITNILRLTGFLSNDEHMEFDYCLTGAHLLKQIQMLPCNAHEVSELQLGFEDEIFNSELKEIGSAAYTTLSLFNHSCDPSVVRHCYGDVCVLRSIKFIRKGEPILDNYGHLYPVETKPDRQKNLQEQYYFKCQCLPCTEDWPLYNDIPQDISFLPCTCDLPLRDLLCPNCQEKDGGIGTLGELQSRFQKCLEDVLNGGSYAENLPVLKEFLNLLCTRAQLPVIDLNNCQEVVKVCFGLQGNYVKFDQTTKIK